MDKAGHSSTAPQAPRKVDALHYIYMLGTFFSKSRDETEWFALHNMKVLRGELIPSNERNIFPK